MKVTYLHHSGFAVETETKVLLFDYYTEGGRYAYFDPSAYVGKDIFVFVSHFHEDHFDRRILDWAAQKGVRYVFSKDVWAGKGFTGEALVVKPHESHDFAGIHIETLKSNDEGVAFLVEADGKTIYHAGDLNWWHWNGESDAFNRDIAKSYTEEIDRLKGRRIDAAFVPADLRLEDKYFWAVDYFMKTIGTAHLFPMHFWGHFDVCKMLREKEYGAKIEQITEKNQTFPIP